MIGAIKGTFIDASHKEYTSKKTGNLVNLITILVLDDGAFMDADKIWTPSLDPKNADPVEFLKTKDQYKGKLVWLHGEWKIFKGVKNFSVHSVKLA